MTRFTMIPFTLAALLIAQLALTDSPLPTYPWPRQANGDAIASRFFPPAGWKRIKAQKGSETFWLGHLPLLPGCPEVKLFNGTLKENQTAHAAVLDIDVGARDLQQCADAAMRLRAELLLAAGRQDDICFKFTNGSPAAWSDWRRGMRPRVTGSRVTWQKSAKPSSDYKTFMRYVMKVFQFAGTASLARETIAVPAEAPVEPGDLFIQGGFPGHAVVVVDVAENDRGERLFLLVQSYMPAQQIHLLGNPTDPALSPWYLYEPDKPLITPEWRFEAGSLRRFSPHGCGR